MENDKELDALFSEARGQARSVPDDLMERVLSDAAQVRAGFSGQTQGRVEPVRQVRPWAVLGGWKSAISFATCAAAGVFIGYMAPSLLDVLGGSDASYAEIILDDLAFLTEGL